MTPRYTRSTYKERDMKLKDIIGDIIGVIAIFGGGYAFLIIGHGLGW